MKFLRIFGLLTVFLGFAFGDAFAAGTGTPRVTYSFVLNDGIGSGGKTHDTANTGLLDYTNEWGWYDTNNTWHRLDDLAAIPTVASNIHKHFAGYKAGNVTVINRIGQFAYSTDALAAFNTDNTQLIAQWPSDKFRILLNDAGGSGGQVSNNEGSQGLYEVYGECYQILYLIQDLDFQNASCASAIYQTPTRIGYNFKGYYSGQNGSGTQIVYENGDINTSANTVFTTNDSTIYAKWEPRIFTVTLNHQSPTNSPAPSTVYLKYATNWYSNSAATTLISSMTTVPIKTNYDFGGYWTGTNGSGTQVIDSRGNFLTTTAALTAITSNATVYAKWTAAAPAVYTVTLNPNGGDGSNHAIYYSNGNYYCDTAVTQTIASNASVFTTCGFRVPTLTNNLFDGYYSNSSAGTQYIDTDGKLTVAAQGLVINTNTTWYAQYQSTTITVKCDCGYYIPAGGTECVECPAGKYCEAGNWPVPASSDQGIHYCNENCSGATSGPGACSVRDCYKTCEKKCYFPNALCPGTNQSSCGYDTSVTVAGRIYLQSNGSCGTSCDYAITPANSSQNWCPITSCPADYYFVSEGSECIHCDTGYSAPSGSSTPRDCTKNCDINCIRPECPSGVLEHGFCTYGEQVGQGTMNQVDQICQGTAPTCSVTYNCNSGYELDNDACVAIGEYTATFTCRPNDSLYQRLRDEGYNDEDMYSDLDYIYQITNLANGDSFVPPALSSCRLLLSDNDRSWFTTATNPPRWVDQSTGGDAYNPGNTYNYRWYADHGFSPTYGGKVVQVQYNCASDSAGSPNYADNVTFTNRKTINIRNISTVGCTVPTRASFLHWKVRTSNCQSAFSLSGAELTPGSLSEQGYEEYPSCTHTLNAQWQCEPGYYMNADGTACVQCPEGNIFNGTTCEPCEDGYQPNAAGTACEPCPTGTAGTDGTCEPCPDGTQPNEAGTACEPCPTGTAGTDGTCEPCEDGYQQNATGTACEPCPAGTYGTGGSCTPCGEGYSSAPGSTSIEDCILTNCPDGQHMNHGQCDSDEISCDAPYATIATRTWNERLNAYGSCKIIECEEGYHIASNACVPDDGECVVANGRGTREWNGTAWTTCEIIQCDPGYTVNNAGTACERCSNYLGYDGQQAVSSYITGCEIASCMYQGQKYALINGECEPICETTTDDTGSKRWDNNLRKCVRTCNPGYKMW